ncbi:MAG: carbohydrate ABC transporter permease [Chloroflexia bacterium]|nr:carbohydrate ABC transporter permease [Chloroflexia bacterium]
MATPFPLAVTATGPRRRPRRLGERRFLLVALVAAIWAFYLFPLVWLIMMSLKTQIDMFAVPPLFIFAPTFEHYRATFADDNFRDAARNSLIVTAVSMVASLALGALAAYGLARFRFRFGEGLAFGLIVGRMIPPIVFVVPLFLLLNRLGLRNTHLGLILVYTAFNLPFVIWMLRSFFEEVPVELEQAAMIDGASRLRAFWSVTMPLAAAGFAATAVFVAIGSWSEFLFALILTGPDTGTLPVYLATFVGDRTINWGGVASTGVLVILPLVVLGMLVQRNLIKGLTMGAMKG